MNIIAASLSVIAFLLLVVAVYRLFTLGLAFEQPDSIPVSELGLVEKDLKAGDEVFIVCHAIEDPEREKSLRDAVIDNFREGVRYHFLVSASNHQADFKRFGGYFAALETIARKGVVADNHLYEIGSLPYEWEDFPYLFYVFHTDAKPTTILVYRGNEINQGIASRYLKIDPLSAHTIAKSVIGSFHAFDRLTTKLKDYIDDSNSNVVALRQSNG